MRRVLYFDGRTVYSEPVKGSVKIKIGRVRQLRPIELAEFASELIEAQNIGNINYLTFFIELLNVSKGIRRWVYANIIYYLQEQAKLSEAFENAGVFPNFFLMALREGEAGDMSRMMSVVRDYYLRRENLNKQVMAQLSLPIAEALLAIGFLFFSIFYLIPKFMNSMKELMGKNAVEQLPLLTQKILKLREPINAGIFFAVIFVLLFLSLNFYRKFSVGEFKSISGDRFIHRLPIIGSIYYYSNLLKLFASLKFFTEIGSLMKGIDSVHKQATSPILRREVGIIKSEIENGATPFDAFSKSSYIPRRFLLYIKIGQMTGRMVEQFENILIRINNEIEQAYGKLKLFSEIVPIMIVGAVVGLLIYSVYIGPIGAVFKAFGGGP